MERQDWCPPISKWAPILGTSTETHGSGVRRVDAIGRRWYTKAFKQEVVAQCLRPGASVSRISIEHGLNTNLVRKWVSRLQKPTAELAPLLPVVVQGDRRREVGVPSAAAIEIRIGEATIMIAAGATSQQIEAIVRALR